MMHIIYLFLGLWIIFFRSIFHSSATRIPRKYSIVVIVKDKLEE